MKVNHTFLQYQPAQLTGWLLLILCFSSTVFGQKQTAIWFKQPARNWNEALPVGNGRLGVMVFGKVNEELLQLNEETLWSGGPVNRNPNPGVAKYLPEVREALFREGYAEGAKLTQRIQGLYSEAYQPLGDLILKQPLTGTPTDYYRELDINNATATTRFTVAGVVYTREIFVSAPDQVIVVRLTASRKGSLTVTAAANSQHPVTKTVMDRDELAIRGKAPVHSDPNYVSYNKQSVNYTDPSGCQGMRFDWRVKVRSTDGKVSADTAGISIQNATEAVLLITF